MQIISIDLREIGRIEKLWEQLIENNKATSVYFADLFATFEFSVRCGFLQQKADDGFAVYTFLAHEETTGEDVGFCTVTFNAESKEGEIEMLYLDPKCRGNGLGTQLFQSAIDVLDANDINNKKLCVAYGNEAALGLYKKFGFFPFTIDCFYKG